MAALVPPLRPAAAAAAAAITVLSSTTLGLVEPPSEALPRVAGAAAEETAPSAELPEDLPACACLAWEPVFSAGVVCHTQ